jgi:hypothetical protein
MIQKNLFGGIVKNDMKFKPLEKLDIHISGLIGHNKPLCCIATNFGFSLGMESSYSMTCNNCKLGFVDNPFKKYEHEKHVKTVMKHKPKYATVRDIFNESQAKANELEYISPEIVMDHARLFISNGVIPIVIPKSEEMLHHIMKMDDIEKCVIGYSAASIKFGAMKRHLNVKDFLEYDIKIHLLGGTPETQVENLKKFEDKVVSIDSAIISDRIRHKHLWPYDNKEWKHMFDVINDNKFFNGYSSMTVATSISLMNYYMFLRERLE